MEGEHDVFVRHACFMHSVGNRAVGPVILNPDLTINDVQMN